MGGSPIAPCVKVCATAVSGPYLTDKLIGADWFRFLHQVCTTYQWDLAVKRSKVAALRTLENIVRALAAVAKHVWLVYDGNDFPGKAPTTTKRRLTAEECAEKAALLKKALEVSHGAQTAETAKLVTALASQIPRDFFVAVWDMVESLKLKNVTQLVAPFEADHQLLRLQDLGEIEVIIADDGDYILNGAKNVISKYKWNHSKNKHEGTLLNWEIIVHTAETFMHTDLTEEQGLLALLGEYKQLKEGNRLKHAEDAFAVFKMIAAHPVPGVLLDFGILLGNDYIGKFGIGIKNACRAITESRAPPIEDAPPVPTLAALVVKYRRGGKDSEAVVAMQIAHARSCFRQATVTRDIVTLEQGPLDGSEPNEAQRAKLGRVETDSAALKLNSTGGAQYDRFLLASLPVVIISPSAVVQVAVAEAALTSEQVKLHLAARGIRVKGTVVEIRTLLRKVFKTEAQPGYGPPRIYYPELLLPGSKFVPLPDGEDGEVGAAAAKDSGGNVQAYPALVADSKGEWIRDPVQVSLFAPHMTLAPQVSWFKTDWQPMRFAQLGGEPILPRQFDRGATHTSDKRDIQLEILELKTAPGDDDEWLFRAKLHHSMPSEDKNSSHFGRVYVGLRCAVRQHTDGYPNVCAILDAGCQCMALSGKRCWHIAGLCYVIENTLRGAGSLIPQSSTAKDKAWNTHNGPDESKLRHTPIGKQKMSHNGRDPTPKTRFSGMRNGEARRLQTGLYSPLKVGDVWAERGSSPVRKAWTEFMKSIENAEGGGGQKCVAEHTWPAERELPGYVELPIESPRYMFKGKRYNLNDDLFGDSASD
jgi:hypothetical protein